MATYVPGTGEEDTKKIIMSLQQIGPKLDTVISLQTSKLTNVLGGDVALNNTGSYFDGPSIAQGTTGTWFVSGQVTVMDTAGACSFFAKLWDGTTLIASGATTTGGANFRSVISLSGVITSPAGNLRISVNDPSTTTGAIKFNVTGLSKDSVITAFRLA